jgi:hypothetical protein
MFNGILALLTRSLRQDARQLRNHIFRLSFVGFIYMAMLWAMLTADQFGAPGLNFFSVITWLNAVFITCAGIGFFATAITEEKEEEVLGLLMMAGLNPIGILLGKSTSRLIQASMLLIVQFPFTLLAVTLGGVTPHQILAAYLALLSLIVFLANLALVFSTICERGGSAAGLTTIVLLLYFILPIMAPAISRELTAAGMTTATWYGSAILTTLSWTAQSCAFLRIGTILETGFKEPIVSTQVISNTLAGMVCFVIAWLIFIPSTNRMATGGVSRGLVVRSNSRLRMFSAGRSWAMPLAWKDFQFIAGGYPFMVIKVILCAVLLAGIVGWYLTWDKNNFDWGTIGATYIMAVCVGIAIEASIMAARIFHEEVRLQTMSSLMMLPRSIPYLGYSKALGCLLGLLPSIGCLSLGVLLVPGADLAHLSELVYSPFVWGSIFTLVIFLHLVALLSLFVKWGALPLAIVVMGPLAVCCPVPQLLILVIGRGGMHDTLGAMAATATVWILMGLVCFVFQMMIAARLQEIGAK